MIWIGRLIMIKLIIFSTLVVNGEPQIVEGALFNEYDWQYDYYIEARRRGNKGDKKRRRGGNGLR